MIPMIISSSKHKYCHFCGRPLIGNFMVFGSGTVVCAQCNHSMQHCTACKEPARELMPVDEHRLCVRCLNTLSRCSVCQKPLIGKYFLFGDPPRLYCAACSQQRPHCE